MSAGETPVAPDVELVSVSFRGKSYSVPICLTVGALREAIAAATGADAASLKILGKGKQLPPTLPPETDLPAPFTAPGAKLMVMETKRASPAATLDPALARVRALEVTVVGIETEVDALLGRVGRLRLGFLDTGGTAEIAGRIQADGKVLEERLMRCVLQADALEGEGSDERLEARWRAERKALVVRIQRILRRCDVDIEDKLLETTADDFDEMKHRRGKS